VAEDPAAASWRWNGRWKPIPQTHSTEWKEVSEGLSGLRFAPGFYISASVYRTGIEKLTCSSVKL